jgi:hypothetical protein
MHVLCILSHKVSHVASMGEHMPLVCITRHVTSRAYVHMVGLLSDISKLLAYFG